MAMRSRYLAVALSLFLFVGLSASHAGPPAPKWNESARSRKAIAKVRPGLEKQLEGLHLAWGAPVFLRLFKEERQLELWMKRDRTFALVKTYPICYYSGKLGPKQAEGDLQAPEGFYEVTSDLMNPWSDYHLSFNIGYPNRFDRSLKRTGSLIMVHGSCVSIGCFAMTDPAIEEIWALVDAALRGGQQRVPVHVFPFHLTDSKLDRFSTSRWSGFWKNLQEGYLLFEERRRPPIVSVKGGRYRFR
ncbi:Murein L,D-transpeptidase [Sulfidibacter corallicola]